MDLPYSDGCFVKAYPAETAEAFCDGHVAAFDFLGSAPQSILYDNTKLAVAKIVKSAKRLRSKMFAELQSHYLFEDRFGRPGKGNDKAAFSWPTIGIAILGASPGAKVPPLRSLLWAGDSWRESKIVTT